MTTDKLALTVVTPRGFVTPHGFAGKAKEGIEVDEVTATGIEGEFGVLPGHVPFLTYLKPGALQFRQGQDQRFVAVTGGLAVVGPHAVTILADAAEFAEDIDVARALSALERAARTLESGNIFEDKELELLKQKHARALARLAVAEKIRKVV